MLTYIIRRLLLMIPTLIGITAVVFFAMAMAPGGFKGAVLSAEGGQKQGEQARYIEAYFNKRYGLNKPVVVQYGRWLNQVSPVGFATHEDGAVDFDHPRFAWPNLGESLRGTRVTELLAQTLPITFLLNLVTLPLIYGISIIVGTYAARHRGTALDVGSSTVLLALWSVPVMWAGVMLIGYFANVQHFRWFPTAGLHSIEASQMLFLPRWTAGGFERGWLLDTMWHMVLPVICLTYGGFAVLTKLQRGAILENMSADYVRTARAKGLADRDVLFRHVFRNSLLPLITVLSGIVPSMLVGSIVVENIFSIQGMGNLGIEAARMKDREVVLAVTLIGGLIGLMSDIVRDVCYAIADPRVSYE